MLITLHYPKMIIHKHSLNEFEKTYLPEYLANIPATMDVQEDNKTYTVSSFDNGASYRMLVQLTDKCDIELM